MDIKHLHYFISIVDHGGYSNAARSLFITQPTLSQTIKKLESDYILRFLFSKLTIVFDWLKLDSSYTIMVRRSFL